MNISNNFIRGSIVLISIIILILGGSIPRYDSLYAAPFQPKPIAFSIWILIYLSLFVMAFKLFSLKKYPMINYIVGFLSLSLLFGGGWGLTVLDYPIVSSVMLYISALCAIISTGLLKPNLKTIDGWLISLGPSLLAGWLSLASALGFSVAANSINMSTPNWILLPTGLLASLASIYSGTPGTGLALLWGGLYSKNNWVTNSLIIVAIISIISSMNKGLKNK